jgi:FkbM family methyltransferase
MNKIVDIEFSTNNPVDKSNSEYICKQYSFKFNLDLAKKNHQTINGWLKSNYLYEPDVAKFICRILKPRDMAVDVGANVGIHTLLMATLVEKEGFVFSIDPSDENIAEIQDNVRINSLNNVYVKKSLMGGTLGDRAYFHHQITDSGNSHVTIDAGLYNDANTKFMEIETLDHLLQKEEKIKLIKMDVEGYEVNILKGAEKLLERKCVKYWIVEYCIQELVRMGESLESLRELMSKYGLSMFVLDANGGFPKYYPRSVDICSPWLSNLLFAYPEELGMDWIRDDTATLNVPLSKP